MTLRQLSTLDRQKRGKPIIDNSFMICLRDILYPLLMLLSKTKVRCGIKCQNTYEFLPDKPMIFAANHSNCQDMPVIMRVTGQRSYILAGKQRLTFVDDLFTRLLGAVWVDRTLKEDMRAVKESL